MPSFLSLVHVISVQALLVTAIRVAGLVLDLKNQEELETTGDGCLTIMGDLGRERE